MRLPVRGIVVLAAFATVTSVAFAAKRDPAVYPSPNSYREPAAGTLAPEGRVKVIREFCPGGGRGLVHFLDVDGRNIRARGTWPTYLELAPGAHRLTMEFKAPSNNPFDSWNGDGGIELQAEAGQVYVVRYLRTAVDGFRVWVEPYSGEAFGAVGVATAYCGHPPVADRSLHQ